METRRIFDLAYNDKDGRIRVVVYEIYENHTVTRLIKDFSLYGVGQASDYKDMLEKCELHKCRKYDLKCIITEQEKSRYRTICELRENVDVLKEKITQLTQSLADIKKTDFPDLKEEHKEKSPPAQPY